MSGRVFTTKTCIDNWKKNLLNSGGQPNFARCLAISWARTLYIHFCGSCPLMEFCQMQNSLYFQVLCSPILAALLYGTPAAGVGQTLRPSTLNGIVEVSQMAPPIFVWVAVTLGIGQHSSIQPLSHFPVFKMSLWPPCVADAYIIFSSCGYGHPIE